MADNVTAGGNLIATDETSTTLEHVQLFKLAIATDGSRVLIPADADGLEVKVKGLVSDSRQSYNDGDIKQLSITTDGRLRVATSESATYVEMFLVPGDLFFGVPDMTQSSAYVDVPNNPWGF